LPPLTPQSLRGASLRATLEELPWIIQQAFRCAQGEFSPDQPLSSPRSFQASSPEGTNSVRNPRVSLSLPLLRSVRRPSRTPSEKKLKSVLRENPKSVSMWTLSLNPEQFSDQEATHRYWPEDPVGLLSCVSSNGVATCSPGITSAAPSLRRADGPFSPSAECTVCAVGPDLQHLESISAGESGSDG